ncbi:MAG TPA: DNA polymerase Y family protein [Steroidobacteraceae bacterium]|nr:DNA polymerase Y family protein [Steroidobacteraceae bacterium]
MKPAFRATPAVVTPAISRQHPSPVPRPADAAHEARELWVGVHVPHCEPTLLERLAVRAQRFTPRVSLAPPDGLSLEVRGSLHLFGGAEHLRRTVAAECAVLAPRSAVALAPTTLAALAGARAGTAFVVTDPARLVGQLASLPLGVLRWPQEALDRLVHIGVRTIGQALRLPRAGFARRFGAAQLDALDRLIGRRADPQQDFRACERFRARREPPYELEHHEAILATLAGPLAELERFLRGRQCGITELLLRLHHRHAPATRCVLSLAAPEADAGRLTALLAEKLAQLALPEPVRLCELRSGPLVPRASVSNALWQPGEHGGGAGAEAPAFIERLRTRLGDEAVYGLQLLPEHRPEAAWRLAAAHAALERPQQPARRPRSTTGAAVSVPWSREHRPLWLLPAPQPLPASDGLPRHHGPLRLLSEPERIETGWWDGRDVARDYYVAQDARGARLWVYRERAPPHGWFLHGIFG